eukprot:TRINITY_DN21352_c0_g2_i1.p1 TRINITY_DN21352_c0_g2~~TRINITY_DN21352_c0_g2_i1.p1  ORF type:complete len:803 (-),score=119.77 TRINITY_DN21352_c0_g2_i1:128-2401(-)
MAAQVAGLQELRAQHEQLLATMLHHSAPMRLEAQGSSEAENMAALESRVQTELFSLGFDDSFPGSKELLVPEERCPTHGRSDVGAPTVESTGECKSRKESKASLELEKCVHCNSILMPDAKFCFLSGFGVRRCACGNSLLPDSIYCRKCGMATDARVCTCGNMLREDSTFCRKCGQQWEGMQSAYTDGLAFRLLKKWHRCKSSNAMDRVASSPHKLKRIDNSSSSSSPLRRRRCLSTLSPNSPFRLCWDLCTSIFLVYDALMLPIKFIIQNEPFVVLILDWVLRVFWSCDVCMSFVTGFVNEDGTVERRLSRVVRRYARGWMTLDLLIVASDWAIHLSEVNSSAGGAARSVKMYRFMRLARMFRMLRVYRLCILSTKYTPGFRYLTRSGGLKLAMELSKMMIGVFWLLHVIACSWYFVGNTGYEGLFDEGEQKSWLVVSGAKDLGVFETYVIAYEWALSNFVGDSNVSAKTLEERLAALLVMIMAFIILAVVPPRITAMMTTYLTASAEYTSRFVQLTDFLRDNGISQRLAVRVQRAALNGLRVQQAQLPEQHVFLLQVVPLELRSEIRWSIYSSRFLTQPLFLRASQANVELAKEICYTALCPITVAQDEILFQAGDAPDVPKMFIQLSGELHYSRALSKHNALAITRLSTPINSISTHGMKVEYGCSLSEASIWTEWQYRGDAQATVVCELLTIDGKMFADTVIKSELRVEILAYGTFVLKRLNGTPTDDLTDVGERAAQDEDALKALRSCLGQI